jgi:endoglucanase
MRTFLLVVLSAFLTLALAPLALAAAPDAFAAAKRLGRGINLGNALEAPSEGEWGVTLKPEYFAAIKDAGFDSIRLPVRWSAHAQKDAPYTLDPKFCERVDWALDQATQQGLVVILNMHHYDEIYQDLSHAPRFAAMWKQIAARYRDRPDTVYFEFLNEPHTKLTDEAWSKLFAEVLREVRRTNPTRPVVVGPSQWNSIHNLSKFTLPEDDQHLIATFHYYLPFQFTHQGASWAQGSDAWKGRKWPQSPEEQAALAKDFATAAQWSKEHHRPLLLGEFGAYSAADMDSRVRWTNAVAREAEKHGFPWAYWEFCSGFGAFDPQSNQWRAPLLKALIP